LGLGLDNRGRTTKSAYRRIYGFIRFGFFFRVSVASWRKTFTSKAMDGRMARRNSESHVIGQHAHIRRLKPSLDVFKANNERDVFFKGLFLSSISQLKVSREPVRRNSFSITGQEKIKAYGFFLLF
jgi:hypothetical protein